MPYSQQQLENALRKADAAGDKGAAQVIANELRQLKGGAAPRAQTAPSSPSSLLSDIGGGAWAATKGAAKGMVGDVVGAGQLASDIPGVKSALKAIPGMAEDARWVRDWSRSEDPDYRTMGELGRMAGAAAPIAATMPLTGLGALADAAAFGGLTGLVQPTQGGDWSRDIPEHAKQALYGGAFGMIPGLGGIALQRLAPLAGVIARYLPGLKIGGLFGHPYLGMHYGGKALASVQPAVTDFTRGVGKAMTPHETAPPWLNVRGVRKTPSYSKPPVQGLKGWVARPPPGEPPPLMPRIARKNKITAPAGTLAPAAAGAEAEEPQAGKTDDPMGYLRYGEQ